MNGQRKRRGALPPPANRGRTAAALLAVIAIGIQAGCSEQPKPRAPTEQEIHSMDSETKSRVKGRHLYACDDGVPLFVDFKDEGLSLELRREELEPSRVLKAPSQGLQYVGDNESAIMTGNELRLASAEGRTRVCRRQN